MRKHLYLLLALMLLTQLSFSVKPIKKEALQQLLNPKSDTTYVINFWATWCAPCVKELPHFVKLQNEYSNRPVKVILISLDFASQLNSRVVPFLKKNGIVITTYLLNEPNANRYSDLISKAWSGAIPATVIVSKHQKEFYEKEFTYDDLKKSLDIFLSYNKQKLN